MKRGTSSPQIVHYSPTSLASPQGDAKDNNEFDPNDPRLGVWVASMHPDDRQTKAVVKAISDDPDVVLVGPHRFPEDWDNLERVRMHLRDFVDVVVCVYLDEWEVDDQDTDFIVGMAYMIDLPIICYSKRQHPRSTHKPPANVEELLKQIKAHPKHYRKHMLPREEGTYQDAYQDGWWQVSWLQNEPKSAGNSPFPSPKRGKHA